MFAVEVALVVGKMMGGGVEAVVMSYVEAIDSSRVHFTLLVDSDSTQVYEELIRQYGADLIYIPPYQQQVAYQRALNKIFQEIHFDIVHSHINTLSVFPLFTAWRSRVPVRVIHNHTTVGCGEIKKSILKYLLRPFAKVFATHLCACGQYAGAWIYGKKAIFTVLPISVDFKAKDYAYSPKLRAEKRQDLGVGNDLLVGHVGRFQKQKNHAFLLNVFAEIYHQKPSTKLLLVGSGDLVDEVKKQAKALLIEDAIIFAGQRQDVAALYQAMDLFILPSLYEGVGVVALEAQLTGLPVLVSDVITDEIVCSEKQVVFLPLTDSPKRWAQCALDLVKDISKRESVLMDGNLRVDNVLPPDRLTDWYCELVANKEK